MLLDPARPRPVPIGSLVQSAGTGASAPLAGVARRTAAPGAGTRGDGFAVRGRLPRRACDRPLRPELDETAVSAAATDQGDGPVDVHVIEYAIAGGYRGDAAAADAVTVWIAETLRRGIQKGSRRAGIPRAFGPASRATTRSAGWCADGSDGRDPRGRHHLAHVSNGLTRECAPSNRASAVSTSSWRLWNQP